MSSSLSPLRFMASLVLVVAVVGFPSIVAAGPYEHELTDKNFKEMVLESKGAWLVEFFAPWCGHCKNLAPQWSTAAKKVKDMVHFGAVDCTQHQNLCAQYGVRGYPTIKTFPAGIKTKSRVQDYQGARQAGALTRHAFQQLTGRHVTSLDVTSFQKWFAENPAQKKALLFTDKKDKIPGLWKSLSMEFEGKLSFAIVHKDQEPLMKQFQVTDVPAVLIVSSQEDAARNEGRVDARKYAGKFSFIPMTQFIAAVDGQSPPATGVAASTLKEPEPTLHTIMSQEDFQTKCMDRAGMCLVSLLAPDAWDSNKYDKDLNALTEKHLKRPIHFLKANRFVQDKFFRFFGLADDGDVSAVIIHPKKKRFVNFVGAFDEEHVSEFLDDLSSGRLRTAGFKTLPEMANSSSSSSSSSSKKEL